MRALNNGRVSWRFVALYALAYASLWLALLTPAMISLALHIQAVAPGTATASTSLVLYAGALVALISNPVFGALSDRTASRYGRRRPWLMGGALCGFIALVIIGYASTVTMILVGWCLAQLAYNAALAALVAVIPDQIPSGQRGTVVGVLGVCMPIGQIGGAFLVQQLANDIGLVFLVPGAIGLLGLIAFAMALPETSLQTPPESTRTAQDETRAAPLTDASPSTPNSRSNFLWAWLSRVMFVTGSVFLTAYQPFFLINALHFHSRDTPSLVFQSTVLQAVMMVIFSLLAGRLSDRVARRKPFVVAGSIIQGAGLGMAAFAGNFDGLLLAVALIGIGHGVYEGVDLALVTEVLPDRGRHAAQSLGLLNIANTLPQVVAPLSAPAILAFSNGNYSALFAVGGAVTAFSAVCLLRMTNVR